MGKGKGSRCGIAAKIKASSIVLAAGGIRCGLILKLFRFIKTRCSFKTVLMRNFSFFYHKTGLYRNFKKTKLSTSFLIRRGVSTINQKKTKLSLKRRVYSIIQDIFGLLTKIKKMKLLLYFYKVFPVTTSGVSIISMLRYRFKSLHNTFSYFFILLGYKTTLTIQDCYVLTTLFSQLNKYERLL